MGSRRQVIAGLGALVVACATACTSASSSPDPSPATPPVPSRAPNGVGSSTGSSSGGSMNGFVPSQDMPAQCFDFEKDGVAVTPIASLTEATLRARIGGIYRACATSSLGIEVRVDPDSGSIAVWSLDDRFVRVSGPNASGTVDVTSCTGPTCSLVWHFEEPSDALENEIRVYEEPKAIELVGNAVWLETHVWVRVAD